ncbi:hypothetical protein NKG05_13890 [Oerskovia sp. M15]
MRDIAKGEGKSLWMSEVGGFWSSTGQDFVSMESGLGSAQQIADDLRELEPSAWVFWQPVEDYTNMAPGGESAAGMNWGEIQIPFDCTAEDTLETCPIYTNTKYQTTQNFTHFIAPGDHLIGVDDVGSTAAVAASGDAATVVHVNSTTSARAVTLDLSGFASIEEGATVTPFVTSTSGALVEGTPVAVESGAATLTVPAESVTTFVVDGVAGSRRTAPWPRTAMSTASRASSPASPSPLQRPARASLSARPTVRAPPRCGSSRRSVLPRERARTRPATP